MLNWTGVLYVLDWYVVCNSHTWLHIPVFPVACFRTRGGGGGGGRSHLTL